MIVGKQKIVFKLEDTQKSSKIASVDGSAYDNKQNYETADNAELETISKKLIHQNMEAYKKLAE